ncbi:hypothetical protein PV439_39270, partial [Streptomyces scabiei]
MLLATAALLVDDIVGSLFRRAAHDRGNSGDGLPGWEPAGSRVGDRLPGREPAGSRSRQLGDFRRRWERGSLG